MENEGLITAFIFDGKGGGYPITWEEVRSWAPDQGVMWVHLNYTDAESRRWVLEESNLPPIAAQALLTEETRPRTTLFGDAALLALRGVNLNPGSDPVDMISIRAWATGQWIITTHKRPLLSITDITNLLDVNTGPLNTGDFIVELIHRLTLRIEDTIEEAEDQVAQLEEDVVTTGDNAFRSALSDIRRRAIILRRYLSPQREAMIKLYAEHIPWLTDTHRLHLHEATNRLIRHIEDLDAIRDRAAITQEELSNRHSEQMNERMYVLSLMAAIFLPLGFLTGLLGINLGGIPGAGNKWAFLFFLAILAVVICCQLLYFKKRKWL
jgi:zinc transporter